MFCPNCGKQISDNSKFCGFCGAVVTPPAVLATPVEQPVAEAPVAEQPAMEAGAVMAEAAPEVEQPVTEVPVAEQAAAEVLAKQPEVEAEAVMTEVEQPATEAPAAEQAAAEVLAKQPEVEAEAVMTEAAPEVEQPVTEAPVAGQAAAEASPEQPPAETPVFVPEQPAETAAVQQPAMQSMPMQQMPQQMYQQPAAPMQQPVQGGMPPFSPVPPAEKKKKKGKAGLIIVLVILLLAVAGGGVFFFMHMNRPSKKIADAFAANDIDKVVELYEKVGDKDMEEVVSQAREYAEKLAEGYLDGTGEQDYKTVVDTLSKLSESVLLGEQEVTDWIYTVGIVEESRTAFRQAESNKESGLYVEALDGYAQVIEEDTLNYAQAQQAIEETKNLYREAAIKEAKFYEDSGSYEEARDVYEEALTVLEDDAQILEAMDALEAAVVAQIVSDAVEEADRAASEGRYSDALDIINIAMGLDGLSSAQQQALSDKQAEITDMMYADGSILGTWKMECDISEAIAVQLGADFEDFEGEFFISLMFDFNEDGTFRMYVDEESFRENLDGWLQDVILYTANIMYDMFAEVGFSKEEADALVQEMYGITMEEYLWEYIGEDVDPEELSTTMLEGMETTGVYRVEEDRLYIADQEIDESRYDNFHFEEDKLIIELPAEADPGEELLPGISYPFELIKVQ